MATEKPFFIGWQSKPPQSLSRFVLGIGVVTILLTTAWIASVAALQQNLGSGTWDLKPRKFHGLFIKSPTSMLLTQDEAGNLRAHYLVSEFKYGFPQEQADQFHLQVIEIKGTLIQDGSASMIEVVGGSIYEPAAPAAHTHPFGQPVDRGEVTVCGEIVDSKCYLGVMNPGIRKTHRACAINCIRGGVPPILLAESGEGEKRYFLLLGPQGEPIHEQILDFVAEPVEIQGKLREEGPVLVLYVDPAMITRL